MTTKKATPAKKKAPTIIPVPAVRETAPVLLPGDDIDAAIENAKALEARLLEDLREASPEDLAAIALEIQASASQTKALEARKRSIAESAEWKALLERHAALSQALTIKEALIVHQLRELCRVFNEASALIDGLRKVTEESKALGRGIPSPDPARGEYGGFSYGKRLSAVAFGRDHCLHGLSFTLPDPSCEA